jgi:hypothetical protein
MMFSDNCNITPCQRAVQLMNIVDTAADVALVPCAIHELFSCMPLWIKLRLGGTAVCLASLPGS